MLSKPLIRAVAVVTALSPIGALAQDPSVPRRGQDQDLKMPEPKDQVPEKVQPDLKGSTPDLSDKLNKSGGVIKPPTGVDPDMKVQPPEPAPNSTPVIPPPGNAR